MTFNLKFNERMSGNCSLRASPNQERALSFSLQVHIVNARKFRKDRIAEAQGEIHIAGFADHAATRGTVEITPFLGKRIRYVLWFKNNQGERCCFDGQKTIKLSHFIRTMTDLNAQILNSNQEEIGSGHVYFDLHNDLLSWLLSMRVRA